ncbi:MAG: hypothetical protein G01um101418_643 [Parcubacteria group bacterium Gr01-1014_18]|nr:MAG: hypothetical protein Greene041636_646 [Parcubacteria group bacterium Greene0416_36]TSC80724.1 MAG: hypothetical protein G01um101418_643 [Parcubacteria group bacterium Gr01-1014_18]TSC98665.1 MAG: hypothetical protein Greene101420_624 [Parcubacteria group bacterium Greene1014_20]TSD07175.1 MAG: hypothetical protein Greene07142_344 [Parcubacteria group bacterium Greene0714_2]
MTRQGQMIYEVSLKYPLCIVHRGIAERASGMKSIADRKNYLVGQFSELEDKYTSEILLLFPNLVLRLIRRRPFFTQMVATSGMHRIIFTPEKLAILKKNDWVLVNELDHYKLRIWTPARMENTRTNHAELLAPAITPFVPELRTGAYFYKPAVQLGCQDYCLIVHEGVAKKAKNWNIGHEKLFLFLNKNRCLLHMPSLTCYKEEHLDRMEAKKWVFLILRANHSSVEIWTALRIRNEGIREGLASYPKPITVPAHSPRSGRRLL